MPKIRVLVVDDSVVIRRLVANELERDPALEVVGTAANGRIALAQLNQVNPDVVILDIEMPELDGLATLKELRKTRPRLPVIMFSALTERGAAATLEALSLGATDYFTKPTGEGCLEASLDVIRQELIPQIKSLVRQPASRAAAAKAEQPRAAIRPTKPRTHAPEVLTVGTSTGGPNALAELFHGLPADFPLPIMIVQHMPPMFTRLLAERLSAETPFRVAEGGAGSLLQPGHAWIAPGDHHLIVVRDGLQIRTQLNQDPHENSCRPAVDVLLRSVARVFGPHSLNVILTGMGQDGLRGCEAIKEVGGQLIVQDEATSVVWGMPGCVARAGLADRVLPLSLIAEEIVRRAKPNKATSDR